MRAAVIYDIHGNLHALDAVLAEAESEDVDLIVCGGDIVFLCAFPCECLDTLRGAGPRLRAIMGNTDRYVWDRTRPDWAMWMDGAAAWTAERLGSERLAWLAALPARDELPLADALVVHATPLSDEQILTGETPDAEVAQMLAGVTQHVVLCGHTHVPMRRQVGAIEVINPGSVGAPFDGDPDAAWALVDEDGAIHPRRTPYDVEAAIAAVLASGTPAAAIAARRLRESRA